MIKIVKENIKQALKDNKKTNKSVCKEMNVHRKYIYEMNDNVSLSKLVNIADHIGCKIEDIVVGIN